MFYGVVDCLWDSHFLDSYKPKEFRYHWKKLRETQKWRLWVHPIHWKPTGDRLTTINTCLQQILFLTPYLYPMDEKATQEQQIFHCSSVRSLREGKNMLQGITYMET